MSGSKPDQIVRIVLTPSQSEQVKQTTGREAEAIELTVEELEERVAPRLASNSNDTLLVRGD